MKLTSEGEALLQYVKGSLEIEGVALSRIHRAAKENIIDVGISGPSSILRSRVIPNLFPLKEKFPFLRYHFALDDAGSPAEKLKSGNCDFAILEQHQVMREMDSKVIKPERYVLYGPVKWKRRSLTEIIVNETIVDFAAEDLMTFNYLEKYRLKNKARKERHFVNNIDAIAAMVSAGLGYSVLSEEFAKPFVKKNELCELALNQFLDFKIALAWYPRAEMPDYMASIIKAIS